MQFRSNLIILISLFTLIGCVDNSPLILEGTKSDFSVHLGKGVWLTVPSFFEKANSYDGYQRVGMSASISVDIVNRKLEEVKKAYGSDALSYGKLELLALRPVVIGDNEFSFYSKVRNKKKKTVQYMLAIANGAETYRIKAFCFEELESKIGDHIEKAIFSTHIGEKEKENPDFITARIISVDHMILTRDGNYPTKSKDEAVVEEKMLKDARFNRSEGEAYLKNELYNIISQRNVNINIEKLNNGFFMYAGGEFEGKNIYVSLLTSLDGSAMFTKCTANTTVGKTYFENLIRKRYIKTTVSER